MQEMEQAVEMNDKQLQFVTELGLVFEQSGAAPMLGRVYGALLISTEQELTAEDLASSLHASRGSISQTTRQLVQMGLLQKTHKIGSRKDYFRLAPDGWVNLSRYRFEKSMDMAELFERGLDTIPETSPEARTALEENLEFLAYWQEFIDVFFNEWQQRKEAWHAKRNPDN